MTADLSAYYAKWTQQVTLSSGVASLTMDVNEAANSNNADFPMLLLLPPTIEKRSESELIYFDQTVFFFALDLQCSPTQRISKWSEMQKTLNDLINNVATNHFILESYPVFDLFYDNYGNNRLLALRGKLKIKAYNCDN